MLGTNEYLSDDIPLYGVFEESGVECVKLPSTLKKIEYSTFTDCESLKSINLPNKLGYIGKKCFYGSALSYIAILPMLN